MEPVSSPRRVFGIASLVAPSWLAWNVAFAVQHPDGLTSAVKLALGPMWALLAVALVVRASVVLVRRRQEGTPSVLAQLDVLTSSGVALSWFSAFAIMGAVWAGWASLAVVGLLGTGLFHVVVLFMLVTVRGLDPMRASSITRRFSPESVTEGDDVTEELRFAGTRIPTGFRLFVTGRVGPRWATSRHVLDAVESDGDVVLESEIGPALRGEHEAEALEVWLQDAFGLCKTTPVPCAPARLTVLPRLRPAEKTTPLLARGHGPRVPRAAVRLPTEGLFRLREYQQGDDVRRIHWVRSLASRELIVRLPDEVPPDRPHVRLVLDTFFPEAFALACDAPSELLDSLVATWLAVGRSLAESGARVSLVTALPDGAEVEMVRHELVLRAPGAALRLGAQVAWQNRMSVDELLTDEATFVVSRAVLVQPPPEGHVRWILVTPPEGSPEWPFPSPLRLPYPMGSSENAWSHRRREGDRIAVARRDHVRALVAMRADVARPPPGSFVAVPGAAGAVRLEELR